MKTLLSLLSFTILCSILSQAQWSSNPSENTTIAISAGEEAIPKVATNNAGTTYISWFSNESGNYNVRLQKLDLFGNKMWDEAGLLVSDNPSMSWLTDWDMAIDQEDCAILTFQDIRNGENSNDAFSYRISPDGEFLWGENGVEMSSGPAFDAAPKVCVTNSGNAVFAWQAEDVIILQKISPEGIKLWGDDGITLSSSNTFSWPQLLPVGDDNMILKYFEDSGPVWSPTRHVYAQQYDTDGNPVWAESTTISDAGGISAWTQVFPFINDGNDGFYIAWHDDRNNDMHASVFVQHIDSEGTVLLGENGTEASTQTSRQNFYPYLALPEESENIFVYWNEMDSDQNQRGIYGQKISSEGEREWTDNGKALIEISSTNVYPISASGSEEDMTIFYEEYFNAIDGAIHAMRIDGEGDFVWAQEMIEMCSVESEKVHAVAGQYTNGQWIAAWEDSRNGNRDIYAQNIQLDGTLGPITDGEVEVHPDTLYFEDNPQTLQVQVFNYSTEDYVLTNITENGMFWEVDPYPALPFTIPSNDSLVLNVYFEFITSEQTDGYWFDDPLNIISGNDTLKVFIAINEDLLSGVDKENLNEINVYPNPSGSDFTFDFRRKSGTNDRLVILDQNGSIIRQWSLYDKNKIFWDGKSEQNELMPSAIYIYQLISETHFSTGKILLIR